MKKTNIWIIIVPVVILLCILFSKINLFELIIEQNKMIEIIFDVFVAGIIAFLVISYIRNKVKINEYKKNNDNQKSVNEFDRIYQLIRENLESKFKTLKKKLLISGGAFLTISIISLTVALSIGKVALSLQGGMEHSIKIILLLIAGTSMIYFVYKFIKYLKEYHNMYKYGIIGNMVKLLNPNLEYGTRSVEMEKLIKSKYKESGFETDRIDIFTAEDFIAGNMMKDVYMVLSDIYVKREANEEKQEYEKILFNGLFATTTINKNIDSTIKVLTDKLKFIAEKEFIKMDSTELEKYFDIYAENKMLAVRVLTPEIMEILVNYLNEDKIIFEIIVQNNLVHFRFFTGNMFETRILEDPFNKKKLFLYYNALKLVLNLTEKFNENLNSLEL